MLKNIFRLFLLALLLFLPSSSRAAQYIPPEQTGKVFDASGSLEILHRDNFNEKKSDEEYYLKSADKRWQLNFRDKGPQGLLSGSKVRVRGERSGESVNIVSSKSFGKSDGLKVISAGITEAAADQKIAVVLFNFQDKTDEPWTQAQVGSWTFTDTDSVNAYYKETSFNKWQLTGQVYDWTTVPVVYGGNCSKYYEGSQKAKEILTGQGVNFDNFDKIVYAFPTISCGWSGSAVVGGKESWINGGYGSGANGKAPTVVHELGHNFGTRHANSYKCYDDGGNRVPINVPAKCNSEEYGDPFDVMGNITAENHFNNYHKGQLGWFAAGNVRTVTAGGFYDIYPLERTDSRVKSLRIPTHGYSVSGKPEFYYLEYRRPFGIFDDFENYEKVVNGVSIRIATSHSEIYPSQLISTTASVSGFSSAPLMLGKTYVDQYRNVTIKVTAVSDEKATVQITLGGATPTPTPTPSPSPTPTPTPTPLPSKSPVPTPTPTPTPGSCRGCGVEPVYTYYKAPFRIGPFPEKGKVVIYFDPIDAKVPVKIHLNYAGKNYVVTTGVTKHKFVTNITVNAGEYIRLMKIVEPDQGAPRCAPVKGPPYLSFGWIRVNANKTCGSGLAGPPTQCKPMEKVDVSSTIAWANQAGKKLVSRQCWGDWREWPGDYDFNDFFMIFSYQ